MTAAQQRALAAITKAQTTVTRGPTIRELSQTLGIYPFAVQRVVERLRELGHVAPKGKNGVVLAKRKRAPRPVVIVEEVTP